MLPLLSSLSPDAAVLLLTLGVALIAIEINRPGWIVPGALGLLATLLASAAILHQHGPALPIALLFPSAILLLQFRIDLPVWIVVLAAAGDVIALAMQPGVRLPVAIGCGLALGAGTTVLTRIARRARKNKGLD